MKAEPVVLSASVAFFSSLARGGFGRITNAVNRCIGLAIGLAAVGLLSGCASMSPAEEERERTEQLRQYDRSLYELERTRQMQGLRDNDRFDNQRR